MARKAQKAFHQIRVRKADSCALPLILTFTDRDAYLNALRALEFDDRLVIVDTVNAGKVFATGTEAVTEALFWLDLK
jgi:hypothetical protein